MTDATEIMTDTHTDSPTVVNVVYGPQLSTEVEAPPPPVQVAERIHGTLFVSMGDQTWGSSRMRVWWVAQHMRDTEVMIWNFPQTAEFKTKYSNYIFQKYGNPDIQNKLLDMGRQVWLDQCDPMWWFSDQGYMRAMFDAATGAVFSSAALKDDFLDWWGADYNAHVIKDRMNFDHFPDKKSHSWTKPVRFIWFGMSQNRVALHGTYPTLSRLKANGYKVTLTIFDDKPQNRIQEFNDIPILYSTWELHKENAMISGYDLALLPPYPGQWGKVKSNNKNITAIACGVPWVQGLDYNETVKFMDFKERQKLIDVQSTVLPQYDVRLSALEWEKLLKGEIDENL